VGATDATLGGTVDPAGVLGSYHFEYGTGPEYGAVTPDVDLGPDIVPLTVSAPITALSPGTTYHYRLVATNSHGTVNGADAAFTTPAPPPPARVVDQAPPPPPLKPLVALGDVRITPAKFTRSRSRGGHPGRIRWTSSAPATVTLTFERKVRRGKRNRWLKVSGSLKQVAETGKFALPFGGWIGRRPLARGTYRVTLTPRGDDSRLGRAHHATFTLR
jgi:hypothetical protein